MEKRLFGWGNKGPTQVCPPNMGLFFEIFGFFFKWGPESRMGKEPFLILTTGLILGRSQGLGGGPTGLFPYLGGGPDLVPTMGPDSDSWGFLRPPGNLSALLGAF